MIESYITQMESRKYFSSYKTYSAGSLIELRCFYDYLENAAVYLKNEEQFVKRGQTA